MIHFDHATKMQLIQICLWEDCPIEYKHEAVKELNLRWTNDLLPELIQLYGKGLNMSDIAFELGVDPHTVKNKLKQHGLYKKRVKGA